MQVLWVTNVPIPAVAKDAGLSVTPYGGWLVQLADKIRNMDGIELSLLFAQNETDKPVEGIIDKVHYHGFYCKRYFGNNGAEKRYKEFLNYIATLNPDIIHIFGTEKDHSFTALQVCRELGIENRVVVSIQGLVSMCAKHYYADIPLSVRYGYTLRDILRGNCRDAMKHFRKDGEREEYILRHVQNVIGRTDWDEACTKRLNPAVNYYRNNETLRTNFYGQKWEYAACEPHSIFCSQSTYPLKGLHYVLEALPEIIAQYPDTMLYISGENLNDKHKYLLSFYQKYLLSTIKKNGLTKNVTFLGVLQADEMVKAFLKSNVFVCPSSIENSPNSLGEAMLLGMPVISSDVGGVKNMLTHNEEGYIYQHDAPYMLAYYIKKVFENGPEISSMGENAQKHAKETHDPDKNAADLYLIYKSIVNRVQD